MMTNPQDSTPVVPPLGVILALQHAAPVHIDVPSPPQPLTIIDSWSLPPNQDQQPWNTSVAETYYDAPSDFDDGLTENGYYVEEVYDPSDYDLEPNWREIERSMMMFRDGLSKTIIPKYLRTRGYYYFDEVMTAAANEDKICVVCQDNLWKENQTIGVLACGHEYHACCVKQWLLRKNVCPLCKVTALDVYGEIENIPEINLQFSSAG